MRRCPGGHVLLAHYLSDTQWRQRSSRRPRRIHTMSTLAQQVIHPKAIDPNNVQEIYANGPINVNIIGPCATLTFTNIRPDIAQAIKGGEVKDHNAVVVARITIPVQGVVEIKNLLNQMLIDQPVPLINQPMGRA